MASGISTKGRYALRVMADLAVSEGENDWVSLGDVSRRQGISRKYLEQVIRSAEGSSLAPAACLDCSSGTLCPRSSHCPTLPVWQELGALISGYLDSKHLSDITANMTQPEDTDTALSGIEGLCK